MILPSTLADVLQGKYDSVVGDYTIIDCRYPFEFDGGHIKDLCTPQGYVPMRHKDYEADLRLYRGMAKTEGAACKSRSALQVRPLKKF
ncbi:hypothetical protein HPB52_018348 [Rhipicephalus sanguineus]|uniref:protein-tyrosine-phosphatase n=1 Tax=Rhipicephalus sanguineus TaxID=34632 RepID=A0A9D4TB79_RHISA|nr:hypothetical protein HPB52_018348 [Rhipicephalus sanguineus]